MQAEDQIPDLPMTSWAVLGELSFDEELSGYDLKRWAEQSLAFFYWAPSQSQVYSELKRLEQHGLVASRVEQTHEAKSRRLYVITDEGRAAMRAWMAAEVTEQVVLKHPYLLRVWAAHNGNVEDLKRHLERHREGLIERHATARGHAEHAEAVPAWKYPAIALRWSERALADEIDRIDWLLTQL